MVEDVIKIAFNTQTPVSDIKKVKNYLFYEYHDLDGDYKLFDASFEIAESWRRLAFDFDNVKPHDLLLIKHELLESQLVDLGYSQNEAHTIASKAYDYPNESKNYYNSMLTLEQLKQKVKSQKIERSSSLKLDKEELDL